MLKLVLLIIAAICFGLDAFKIPGPLNWTPAGFCLVVVALCII
jgi:hypothetical protein